MSQPSDPPTPRNDRPNVLLIMVDQMRADHTGFNGNPAIRTPNLDRLAAQGVNLPRAYVNCPLCMPSRATLFTGQTPRGHGTRTNGVPLRSDLPTLPSVLAEVGYETVSVGKIHLNCTGAGEDSPENRSAWASGRRTELPRPYYGLNRVHLSIGHGARVLGDYGNWLKEHHPEVHRAVHEQGQPKGPLQTGTFPGPAEAHHSAWVADRTLDELEVLAEQRRPFLLISSFPDPHHPYHPPAPFDSMYQPADVIGPVWRDGEFERLPPFMARAAHERFPLAGTPGNTALSESEYRQILAYQYGQISNIDQQVGRILDGLHQRGLERNTLVVFLSDHGDLMGDHRLLNKGPFHFEGLLRVPMIWRWPGGLPSGQSALGLASLLDFAPTVLDLLGIDAEALAGSRPGTPQCPSQLPPLPGRSLGPMLRGEAEAVQDSVLAENDEDYLGLRLRTLITPTYKLTAYTGSDGAQPFGELFDLARDPHELHNLWGLPEHRHDQAELMHRLHHRLIETESPLPRRLGHA